MALSREAEKILPALDAELRRQVTRYDETRARPLQDMLMYHMGWKGKGAGGRATGKRIRPLIASLACASAGGRWRDALPASAALEIVHNFSLVHDDIQDDSPMRRGRPALWTLYGTPQAINVGDALLMIANEAVLDLQKTFPLTTVFQVAAILDRACLDLARGQFMDLRHQTSKRFPIAAYWAMVDGKTAALIAACTQIGAVLGGASKRVAERYRAFGRLLGLAFQVKDDILGIWGDEGVTGKSAAIDLVEGKLSLPVLYGLNKGGRFAARWRRGNIRPSDATALRRLLTEEGAYAYAAAQEKRLTGEAQRTLLSLKPRGSAGEALVELTGLLLARKS